MQAPQTTSPRPDLCVFVGRFQPLHAGHCRVIHEGLRQGQRCVVLVGSANEARSHRNPFNATERADIIRAAFSHDPRLMVLPHENSCYDTPEWVARTQATVERAWQAFRRASPELPEHPRVALIGHDKDDTTFYLNLFPQWESIDVPQVHLLAATALREEVFGHPKMGWAFLEQEGFTHQPSPAFLHHYESLAREEAKAFLAGQRAALSTSSADLPRATIDFLESFLATEAYTTLAFEYAAVAHTRFQWRLSPYPPIFTTSDAIVIHRGCVLLLRRQGYPGRGLLALPGGFVEQKEYVEDSCLRELREETGLTLTPEDFQTYLRAQKMFQDPYRSSRGRTITHAFLIELPDEASVALDVGIQDGEGKDIRMVPLSSLNRADFFEDHYAIIQHMVKKLARRSSVPH